MDLVINENLQIVFLNLPLMMGGKAKSLTGMFKWDCSSLDFAIKWSEAPAAFVANHLKKGTKQLMRQQQQ